MVTSFFMAIPRFHNIAFEAVDSSAKSLPNQDEPAKQAYLCPMCRGRKQIDLEEHGFYSPSDPSHFGPCPLCNEKGFVVE